MGIDLRKAVAAVAFPWGGETYGGHSEGEGDLLGGGSPFI